ncbi:peptidoglycan editing factor PgeF [Shewanella maritima]|uniref:Purine nucleoside phosphorylase n=1 Tax=Shewanella maritima TaxID=2520507 RepID=A0A411PJG1_9GAMM|nr:peptidoglycan editing factor PgeF [Shewanella maritima]QBF83683.1 peptidoglycan editing factor PgeF [Shewanella maritima]
MWQTNWPVPANVGVAFTDRHGGVSETPFDSLNLGDHVGDAPTKVEHNRQLVTSMLELPAKPVWLKQVHGTHVLENPALPSCSSKPIEADACYANRSGIVCAVMTADCLPVVLCDEQGSEVAAIHAGWRGLCDGIIEQTTHKFAADYQNLIAYLGPAIGPKKFEVGAEVKQAFVAHNANAANCFTASGDKYLANIYQLAEQRLSALGINTIYSSDECTVSNTDFFSYRREKQTGRQATLVWLKS